MDAMSSELAQTARSRRSPWLAPAVFVCVVAFTWRLNANFVLNHFYDEGPTFDSWLFVGMLWHGDWRLTQPLAMGGWSFLRIHFSPILIIPALVSHIVPIGAIAWFAAFQGAIHALLAGALLFVLVHGLGLRRPLELIAAAFAALAYAFSGLAMEAAQQPHYELLIPGFAILFFAGLALRRPALTTASFVLALLTREDVGFHLFGLLFLVVAVEWLFRRHTPWRNPKTVYMLAALAYAVGLMVVRHTLFDVEGAFTRVYVGRPTYAHITWDVIARRLDEYWRERAYLYLPLLISVVWAVVARNPLTPLGFVAFGPWFVLHLFAVEESTSVMFIYYLFPFLISIAWPPLAELLWRDGAVPPRVARRMLVLQCVLLATTLAGFVGGRNVIYPAAMQLTLSPAAMNVAAHDAFGAQLTRHGGEFGVIRADWAGVALAPNGLRRENWLRGETPPTAVDTVISLNPGAQDSEAWALFLTRGLTRHFTVPGTNLLISTNRNPEELPSFRTMLTLVNPLWTRMRPSEIATTGPGGWFVARERPEGLVAHGPHQARPHGLHTSIGVQLPAGLYEAHFLMRAERIEDPARAVIRVDLAFAYGDEVLASRSLTGAQFASVTGQEGPWRRLTIPFSITARDATRYLNFRIWHLRNADLTVNDIRLSRTGNLRLF
jgi:hypothetical protein